MRRTLFPGIIYGMLLAACGSPSNKNVSSADSPASPDEIVFREDGQLSISRDGEVFVELMIEIADTDSTRTRGMMQRTTMPEDGGMLFVFERELDRAFWMANTPIPLDLIFVGADSVITVIKKYMQPLSAQNVPSEGPSQFVLEVIAGYADTVGLIEGDQLSWTRTR